MPFRRGSRLGNLIQSKKHVVDAGGGLTDATSTVILSTSVAQPDFSTTPTEVEIGSTVNGMFIIINIIGSTGAPLSGPVDWYISKFRSGQNINTSFPDPGNTGIASVRNQIFHEEKGVPGSGDGTPHVFKGVIAIPRGMRRQREGDQFFIKLKMSTGDTGTFCLKSIYKEFN